MILKVVDDYGRTALSELEGDRFADSSRPTSDERDFPREIVASPSGFAIGCVGIAQNCALDAK